MKNIVNLIILFLMALALLCVPACTTSPVDKSPKPMRKEMPSVLWHVVLYDQIGDPIYSWTTDNVQLVAEKGAIMFIDPDGRKIVLERNFSFMLVRDRAWTHADYLLMPEEEVEELLEKLDDMELPFQDSGSDR